VRHHQAICTSGECVTSSTQPQPHQTAAAACLCFQCTFKTKQVHGECVTIKTRFRPVPLRWVFCHKAPRQGAVLEDLFVGQPQQGGQQQQQQQQSGGAAVGRLNPRLRMDDWVEEEMK
jgi:hypothetical protein